MIKAICVGQVTYDMIIQTDDLPALNTNKRYEHKLGIGGGKAANIAYLLSKWGIETSIAGVVGSDGYGQKIKKELDNAKVDTRNLETTFENDTEIQISMVNAKTAESMNFVLADNFVFLKKMDFDFSPDIIITDGYDVNASKNLLGMYPKAISMLFAERLTSNILDLCKKVHFLICTKEFAEASTGIKIDFDNPTTLMQNYEKLKDKYDKTQIVITIGNKGAIYGINNQIKVSPALKTEEVDFTGAGTIFRAAFIHTIADGGDIEKAVKIGNIAAGLSITKLGTRKSIPSLDEVNKIYEQNY